MGPTPAAPAAAHARTAGSAGRPGTPRARGVSRDSTDDRVTRARPRETNKHLCLISQVSLTNENKLRCTLSLKSLRNPEQSTIGSRELLGRSLSISTSLITCPRKPDAQPIFPPDSPLVPGHHLHWLPCGYPPPPFTRRGRRHRRAHRGPFMG